MEHVTIAVSRDIERINVRKSKADETSKAIIEMKEVDRNLPESAESAEKWAIRLRSVGTTKQQRKKAELVES